MTDLKIGDLFEYDGITWKVVKLPEPISKTRKIIDWITNTTTESYITLVDTSDPTHCLICNVKYYMLKTHLKAI